MTQWSVVVGDILDQPADVLVCSANPFLTLSGGVGGAFLLRYGPAMQEQLRAYLAALGVRHVPQGTVVRMPSAGAPYKAVLHAVAVDGFYESSAEVVTNIVRQVLTISLEAGAEVVVLPALATGYGKLSVSEFAAGLRPLRTCADGPPHVVVCLKREEDAAVVRRALSLARQ